MSLTERFRHFNAQYFDGYLPPCHVEWQEGKLIEARRGRFLPTGDNGRPLIWLNARDKGMAVAQMTLLHEMVHLKHFDAVGPEVWRELLANDKWAHGEFFQWEMLRLARNGAFKNLW